MTSSTDHQDKSADAPGERRERARIPDDQPAPGVQRRETHQTSEVPLGSGDRPEPPGSGGDSARTTTRGKPARADEDRKPADDGDR